MLPTALHAQSRFGVNVFGVSYHYRSRTYRDESGAIRRYEQINPGLGLEYLISDGHRFLVTADVGLYRDSKDRGNAFGGPALRAKIGPHLLLGAGLIGLTSKTYAVHVAPLPILTARWKRVSLNAIWIPSVTRQESGAIGFFTTLPL